MTTTTDATVKQQSDVKQSFAWGQLFVGSILSGFAIWKLSLKAMDLPLSETLAGLSSAYEQVRDFLMLPFGWIHLDLTTAEKNLLTICFVALAALARAVVQQTNKMRVRALLWILTFSIGWLAYGIEIAYVTPRILQDPAPIRAMIAWFGFGIVIIALLAPFSSLLSAQILRWIRPADPDLAQSSYHLRFIEERNFYAMTLVNALFAAVWGTALLLLNWATS